MIWQDALISGGQWLFIVALIPMLRAPGRQKPPLFTSLLTAMLLMGFAVAYGTLSLTSSMFSSLMLGMAWLFLAAQRIFWR